MTKTAKIPRCVRAYLIIFGMLIGIVSTIISLVLRGIVGFFVLFMVVIAVGLFIAWRYEETLDCWLEKGEWDIKDLFRKKKKSDPE